MDVITPARLRGWRRASLERARSPGQRPEDRQAADSPTFTKPIAVTGSGRRVLDRGQDAHGVVVGLRCSDNGSLAPPSSTAWRSARRGASAASPGAARGRSSRRAASRSSASERPGSGSSSPAERRLLRRSGESRASLFGSWPDQPRAAASRNPRSPRGSAYAGSAAPFGRDGSRTSPARRSHAGAVAAAPHHAASRVALAAAEDTDDPRSPAVGRVARLSRRRSHSCTRGSPAARPRRQVDGLLGVVSRAKCTSADRRGRSPSGWPTPLPIEVGSWSTLGPSPGRTCARSWRGRQLCLIARTRERS